MALGPGSYKYILDRQVYVCTHWDNIPEKIDEIIEFIPDIPEGPHTPEQHKEIEQLTRIFLAFLERCQR